METIRRGGRTVDPFGVGINIIGQPGDWYYTGVPFPSDVKEAKNRVDAEYQGVNRDVQACANLSAGDKAAWASDLANWRKLYCRNDSGTCTEPDAAWFTSGSEMDDVEKAEKLLYAWQQKLVAAKCSVSGLFKKPDVLQREEGTPTIKGTAEATGKLISEAVKGAGEAGGDVVKKLIPWQLWAVAGIVVVVAGVAVVKLAPVAAAAYLPPRRPAT